MQASEPHAERREDLEQSIDLERATDEARAERWAHLVAWLRENPRRIASMLDVASASTWHTEVPSPHRHQIIVDAEQWLEEFSEAGEGVPAILRCVARAMEHHR